MMPSIIVKAKTAQLAKTMPSTAALPAGGLCGEADPDPPALPERGLVVVSV